MADVKVSGLPSDSSLDGNHYLPLNDPTGPTTKRTLLSTLAAWLFDQTNIPAGPGSPVTRMDDSNPDFVLSGLAWTPDSLNSTRNGSMSSGDVYINGRKISLSAVVARAFTASKDTYIDVLDNGNGTGTLVYTEVANGATTGFTLAANSKRLCKVVTGASAITALEITGYDALGNRYYNTVTVAPPISRLNVAGAWTYADSVDTTQLQVQFTRPKDIMTIGSRQEVRVRISVRPGATGNAILYRIAYKLAWGVAFSSIETSATTADGYRSASYQTLALVSAAMSHYTTVYEMSAYDWRDVIRFQLQRDGAAGGDTLASLVEIDCTALEYNKDYTKG